MLAWRTVCVGVEGIVFADTRPKARYITIRSANDAGYEVEFTRPVSVRRAPEYDGAEALMGPRGPNRGWVESAVRLEVDRTKGAA